MTAENRRGLPGGSPKTLNGSGIMCLIDFLAAGGRGFPCRLEHAGLIQPAAAPFGSGSRHLLKEGVP